MMNAKRMIAAALLGTTLPAAQGIAPAAQAAHVWDAGVAQWVNVAAPWDTFAQIAGDNLDQGRRAVSIATTVGSDGQVLYSAVFRSDQGDDAQWITPVQESVPWKQTVARYTAQGYRLVSISAVTNPGYYDTTLYTGVFRGGQGTDAQVLDRAYSSNGMLGRIQARQDVGMQMVSLSTNTGKDGVLDYSGLFRAGQGDNAEMITLGCTWDSFADLDTQYFNQGYRLISISTTVGTDGDVRYSAVYRAGQGDGAQRVQAASNWDDFISATQDYADQGMRLVSIGLATDADGQVLYTGVWRSV